MRQHWRNDTTDPTYILPIGLPAFGTCLSPITDLYNSSLLCAVVYIFFVVCCVRVLGAIMVLENYTIGTRTVCTLHTHDKENVNNSTQQRRIVQIGDG